MTALTVGSLFSGIGGLDLGLERAGMRVIWQSEIDPYCCRVLRKHWPTVENYGDIKNINWGNIVRPDVLCGGYPCQPFSNAGRRKGEDDPRHLWPWVREAISRLRPRYAVLENVRGHLTLGGLSVIGDLTSIGYDAEWRVVSAASVGANHRRDRIIIVAYPSRECGNGVANYAGDCEQPATPTQFRNGGWAENVANTNGERPHRAQINSTETGQYAFGGVGRCGTNVAHAASEGLQGVFRQVVKGHGNGFAYSGGKWWETEPDVGRVANGIPNRVDRLRGLGNAVVPQVAEVIGRLVVAHAETC